MDAATTRVMTAKHRGAAALRDASNDRHRAASDEPHAFRVLRPPRAPLLTGFGRSSSSVLHDTASVDADVAVITSTTSLEHGASFVHVSIVVHNLQSHAFIDLSVYMSGK